MALLFGAAIEFKATATFLTWQRQDSGIRVAASTIPWKLKIRRPFWWLNGCQLRPHPSSVRLQPGVLYKFRAPALCQEL